MFCEPLRRILLAADQASRKRQVLDRPLLGAGVRHQLEAENEHERSHNHSFRGTLDRKTPPSRAANLYNAKASNKMTYLHS
jgi:hypothetical protein